MKYWLMGLCDQCGVGMEIYVSNPLCTASYLGEYNAEIQKFVETHICCSGEGIRLVDFNSPLGDRLREEGWKNFRDKGMSLSDSLRQMVKIK